MIEKLLNNNILLILIIIYSFVLRCYGINNGYWYDEWSSFYHSNPNFSTKQIFHAVLFNKGVLAEGAQPLYFIIASKWNYLFGYSPETLRYFSFFSGSLSIFLFLFLLKEFSKDKFFICFAIFLYSSNYFLIQFSQESRYYSLSLLLTLLNLIFFFKFLKKKKYLYFYIISAILSLLVNIFFSLIILSQLFFLVINKKKIIYFISIIIIILLYFVIDYQYINSILKKSLSFNIQNTINFNFLVGFYFNIFFGSIFLGGLILIFIVLNLKNINQFNKNIIFCIICIITTYSLPVIYSLVKDPILRPRYIIFIVPIIIILFTCMIFRIEKKIYKNISIIIVIAFSLINNFQSKSIIPKPDTEGAITIISYSNNKFLIVKPEDYQLYDLFYNYLVNLQLAKKKKINFINTNQVLDKQFFWSICLNNPRFASNYRTDDTRCLLNTYSKSHTILEIKKVPDYILTLYQKKIE